MPDNPKSISSVSIREAQLCVQQIAGELLALDRRLGGLIAAIEPRPDEALPAELKGVLQVVRIDLLGDAIATLDTLGCLTEEGLVLDQIRSAETADRIGFVSNSACVICDLLCCSARSCWLPESPGPRSCNNQSTIRQINGLALRPCILRNKTQ